MAETLVYNSHGKKYAVPRERVFSISELRRGDHIAFHRYAGLYWHHAIVEYIDIESDEINVIHYFNTAGGFIEDNFSSPKTPAKARVVRGTYKFSNVKVYRMKHERCLDADIVVWRAHSAVGNPKYNAFTNNCEHFAMWCKTGISSSDQVDKAEEMILNNKLKGFASKAGQRALERGVREGAKKAFTRTTSTAAQRAGQEFVQRGAYGAANQALTRSASRAGEAFVSGGVRVTTNQALTRSASTAGQTFVRGGVRVATNQAFVQTACASQTGTAAGIGGLESVAGMAGMAGGIAIGAAIEGISMAYDIDRAHGDMAAGKISPRQFDDIVGKRIVTGTANVGGSAVGMVVGQAIIPVPVVGGVIGAIAGGILGSLFGNTLVNL